MRRIIRVDMTKQTIREEETPEELVALGGRALIDRILSREVDPTTHPLSPENKLILAPGLFAATSVPSSGRLSAGGKSPLTFGIKESNSGGTFATKIGRLGIKALIIEGQPEKGQFVVVIKKDEVTLEPTDLLERLGNYEVFSRLKERYGSVGMVSIGPCGEMMMSSSTIAVSDNNGFPTRHCARGGLGALMGSKKIKAIVVDDRGGYLQKPVDPRLFSVGVKEAVEVIKNNPRFQFFNTFGTPGLIPIDNARGSLPTRNYRFGSFDKYEALSAERMIELNENRGGRMGHACMPGCIVRCSNVFCNANMEYVTSALEFETLAMLGSNLEIDDIDAVAMMNRKCDDYGLDTIEIGATLGVLAETDFFEFGNAEKALSLIDEIGKGSFLGRILGQGVVTTCRVFGVSRVPAVKGQAIPGHSGRSMKGLGVTYATSPQGADHTAGFVSDNPLSPDGQIETSRNAQLNMLLMDSAGFCYFTFLTGNLGNLGLFAKLLNGLYGLNCSEVEVLNIAKTALKEEITFNRRAGFSDMHDCLPTFMEIEPLPPTQAVFDVPKSELRKIFETL